MKLLLITEAPPKDPSRYFYYEEVFAHDSLFREVVRAVLAVEPTRADKPRLLELLKTQGVFLIDVSPNPISSRCDLRQYAPEVIRHCRNLKPEAIILVKTSVFDAVFAPIKAARLPVVAERMPFPGSGRQTEFRVAMRRALAAADWMSTLESAASQ